ncbi:MAG: carbohydrate-binding domain-containing protein, partial [Eubacteriales bacterium]|nr:carbohydrate-binding domain-containing protein [Eubacteriales bacterium]
MMYKKILAALLAAVVCFGCIGCSGSTAETSGSGSTAAVMDQDSIPDPSEMFTDRDFETDYSNYVTVTLRDDASSGDGGGVTIDGNDITITQEGTYLLTGALSDGQIVVDVDDTEKVQLILDNASISNSTTAALYIREADKVFLTTAADSNNTLESTGDFSNSDESSHVDGTIFSKADLTLNGNGSLTIACSTAHGIVSKDDLKITSGAYNITSAKQGLSGKDSVRIAGGSITITSDTDGIHAENTDDTDKGYIYISDGTLDITSSNDAFDASNYVAILDGTFHLTTGGGSENATKVQEGTFTGQGFGSLEPPSDDAHGQAPDNSTGADPNVSAPESMPDEAGWNTSEKPNEAPAEPDAQETTETDTAEETTTASDSYKGIKADTAVVICGGTFEIDSADDALHTNGSLSISGGTFSIASGDDGIHADASLTITDGDITISQSYEGIEASEIDISGGSIDLTASDDGLNAAGGSDGSSIDGRWGQNDFAADENASISISGGTLQVTADGDGLDSNGSLLISGGVISISAPINGGNSSLDYTSSGTITGGTLIAAGASGMEMNFDADSTQGCIHYDLSSVQSAGTEITLADSSGNVIASYTPELDFQCILISAPDIASDGSYTLTAGSESV